MGNLTKGFTVRNTRGLPFNASYACMVMHEAPNHPYQSLFSDQSTPHSQTPPGGRSSWAYQPYLPPERKQGKDKMEHKQSKRLCTRVYVLITRSHL